MKKIEVGKSYKTTMNDFLNDFLDALYLLRIEAKKLNASLKEITVDRSLWNQLVYAIHSDIITKDKAYLCQDSLYIFGIRVTK